MKELAIAIIGSTILFFFMIADQSSRDYFNCEKPLDKKVEIEYPVGTFEYEQKRTI